jgi:hypothetical protein
MRSSMSKFCRFTLILNHSQERSPSLMPTARLQAVALLMVLPVLTLHPAKLPKRPSSSCFAGPVTSLLRRVA